MMSNCGEATFCKRGHPLTGDNLKFNCRGDQMCRSCVRQGRERALDRVHLKIGQTCKHGHAFVGDNLTPRGDCRECVRRNKRNSRKDAAGKLRYGFTKTVVQNTGRERIAAAFELIRDQGRIKAAWAELGRYRTEAIIYFSPAIARQMRKIAADRRAQLRAEITKPPKPAIIRVASVDLLDRIAAVVPRGLAPDHRDDVISDMVEAVLAGRIKADAIAQHVNQFVRLSYRVDHNKWGDLSLDMPAFREGKTPLIETISKGLWQ